MSLRSASTPGTASPSLPTARRSSPASMPASCRSSTSKVAPTRRSTTQRVPTLPTGRSNPPGRTGSRSATRAASPAARDEGAASDCRPRRTRPRTATTPASGSSAPRRSPDGSSLYAASEADGAVTRFDRDPATARSSTSIASRTAPSPSQLEAKNNCTAAETVDDDADDTGSTDSPTSPWQTTVATVYGVASDDASVVRFPRQRLTASLTYEECFTADSDVGAPTTDPGDDPDSSDGRDTGSTISSPRGQPRGKSVYTASDGRRGDRRLQTAIRDRGPHLRRMHHRRPGRNGNDCTKVPEHRRRRPRHRHEGPDRRRRQLRQQERLRQLRNDSAVSAFGRDPETGALTYIECSPRTAAWAPTTTARRRRTSEPSAQHRLRRPDGA